MRLPINNNASIIIEYAGINRLVQVKQVDVVLVNDLLYYPNLYSLSNLDYYAVRQSLNRLAMMYSSFVVVANKVSPSRCLSFTYNLYSALLYV
jgi:hypothetical protein